jgi:branched-chain amino acid transport system ATP-binding protein
VFPSLTVFENLQMGAYTDAGRAAWKQNLEKIYSWFPVLAERAKAQAGALSGGQQQMLAIARGLASSPKLLCRRAVDGTPAPTVADEIFRGLSSRFMENRPHRACGRATRRRAALCEPRVCVGSRSGSSS